ncbi:hypothetical protein KIW84_070782 [Lathyrus oleraceus]|uniref:Uncharacterized protein n=1 Tax=Pisum sativum TaxID=3888 RepID=A0A9D4ZUX6_PEA|nr:hypothetical protein KIW84_070782 [Pisum sativum]
MKIMKIVKISSQTTDIVKVLIKDSEVSESNSMFLHFMPSTNSSGYINTRQKIMLFLLDKGVKLGLPSLLFKFIRDSIIEYRTGGSFKKSRSKFIPNGRLILDILVESGVVESGLIEELVIDAGKVFWGKNMKINGASPEPMEEEEEEEAPVTELAQNIEFSYPEPSVSEPEDSAMEEALNQIIVSEASMFQPIPVSLLRTIEQIKTDNAKVNKRMDT